MKKNRSISSFLFELQNDNIHMKKLKGVNCLWI